LNHIKNNKKTIKIRGRRKARERASVKNYRDPLPSKVVVGE